MSKEKTKVHFNDIIEAEGKIPVKTYIVGNKVYNSNLTSKQQLSTHYDCERCKQEFEKQYTYDKYCQSCTNVINKEKYNRLELVEWDGSSALCIYDDDTYFFGIDDVEMYCEDNDLKPSELKLVLCKQSTFTQIDYDIFQDEVHDDWEPSDKMKEMVNQFNKFLESESTETWFPTNKRVTISDPNNF